MNPTVYLLIALVALAFVLYASRERFQPEFLDKRQVEKTVASEDSSFTQQTNHMQYAPANMGSIQGMETPFQVNQYKAYVQ